MLTRLRNFLKGEFDGRDVTYNVPPEATLGLLQVTADGSRCVQCGICGFNCPVGIEVREFARRGLNVSDSRCIACGACVELCPRGTLRWGPAILVREDNTIEVNPSELPEELQLLPRRIQ